MDRDQWIKEYMEYIVSPEWQGKANEAKDKAGQRCRINVKHVGTLHAHHRSYQRFKCEDVEMDITVLCDDCHAVAEANHKSWKEGRGGLLAEMAMMWREINLLRNQLAAYPEMVDGAIQLPNGEWLLLETGAIVERIEGEWMDLRAPDEDDFEPFEPSPEQAAAATNAAGQALTKLLDTPPPLTASDALDRLIWEAGLRANGK